MQFLKTLIDDAKQKVTSVFKQNKNNYTEHLVYSNPSNQFTAHLYIDNTTYVLIEKNGREYCDGYAIAECNGYYLIETYCDRLVLFSKDGILSKKPCDECIEFATISHDGTAIAICDEHVYILSENKNTTKSFAYGIADLTMRASDGNIYAYLDDDFDEGDRVRLNCFNTLDRTFWSRTMKHSIGDNAIYCDNPTLSLSDQGFEIVLPDKQIKKFTTSGKPIKG